MEGFAQIFHLSSKIEEYFNPLDFETLFALFTAYRPNENKFLLRRALRYGLGLIKINYVLNSFPDGKSQFDG